MFRLLKLLIDKFLFNYVKFTIRVILTILAIVIFYSKIE